MTKEQWAALSNGLSEFFYIVIGLIFLLLGIRAFKQNQGWKRVTTGLFWWILALIFAIGPYLPYWVSGILVVVLAVLSLAKGVEPTRHKELDKKECREKADKLGYKVFIPALVLALASFLVAQLFPKLGSSNAIGISAVIALIVALFVTKANPKTAVDDGLRLLDNMGSTSILPQLLAALGAVFTTAGVGDLIAQMVSHAIPEGSPFMASLIYCLGMALFTMIMGNGFAAFSVITVGIGIPFLINQGANPVIVGALGLTAGYCGTLMTPMAANFNMIPAALLETKDQYTVIKAQLPMALILLAIHVLLIYFFAF